MEKEAIVRAGYKQLDAANYEALMYFITKDATMQCDIYGNLPLAHFFKLFLNDTVRLTTDFKKITRYPLNSNFITAVVRFVWTLKDEQVVTGDAMVFFSFDSDNKITYIRSSYNFTGLSEQKQLP
jgi:hypothetical protein